ncbi:acetyltransferase (plasmid) [Mycetohabitans rhizoxinica]
MVRAQGPAQPRLHDGAQMSYREARAAWLTVMPVPPCIPFHCTLRAATLEDFDFAEALTCTNMGVYYRRHGLTWHVDLFLTSWWLLENYIVERDR